MVRQKKQYRPIAGQKRWEKVLDWITREENFRWSLIGLGSYSAILLISSYITIERMHRPDIAEIILQMWFGLFPFTTVMAMINPWSSVWGLRLERKLQQPIKDYIEQHGSCTYDELVTHFMPVKIHLGIDEALEHLLRSHELVLENDHYRLPTQEEHRERRKTLLMEYGVKISFQDLERIFALDLDETEGSTSIKFCLLDGGDYWIWKDIDESSGKELFFFSSAPKHQQTFCSFQELTNADLFDGQTLREIWNDAVITFLNDHWDIEQWLRDHLG